MTTQLCRRCRYHPASPRIAGYCSWDCYEADEDEADDEEEGGKPPDPRSGRCAQWSEMPPQLGSG